MQYVNLCTSDFVDDVMVSESDANTLFNVALGAKSAVDDCLVETLGLTENAKQ